MLWSSPTTSYLLVFLVAFHEGVWEYWGALLTLSRLENGRFMTNPYRDGYFLD
ncbi:hypothetical protein CWATWH0402_6453 [Crocosphaera watsonii WH 0402]|uniref:Uncharacterized protein n=1 Tax=Crocosphaera watsonii WH 0402 TaxID=1284629 RepID=T2JM55_CROWT|nr:hypothetical protein CWATWH0402_6453 [Crocosphaera watsonii WH 0402]